jgi:hypothetical protein
MQGLSPLSLSLSQRSHAKDRTRGTGRVGRGLPHLTLQRTVGCSLCVWRPVDFIIPCPLMPTPQVSMPKRGPGDKLSGKYMMNREQCMCGSTFHKMFPCGEALKENGGGCGGLRPNMKSVRPRLKRFFLHKCHLELCL